MDSKDAPLGVRDLLRAGRPPRPLDDRTFRRAQERIATMTLAPAAAAAIASVWTKLAAAGAIVAATTGAVVAIDAVHSVPSPALPAAVAAPVTAPATAAREIPEPEPMPEPAATAPPAAPQRLVMPRPLAPPPPRETEPAPAAEPAPARPKSTLNDELVLLDDARAHLAHDPVTALDRLAAHRARFGTGVLSTERDLMELDALRRAGRVQDARERASAWLAREPNGIHAGRLRAIAGAGESR
jgi:hypothetical protein